MRKMVYIQVVSVTKLIARLICNEVEVIPFNRMLTW